MKTFHVALALTLMVAAACNGTDPNDFKFDGLKPINDGKAGQKDTGPDLGGTKHTWKPCELIITEVMSKPEKSVEWIEIYNATSEKRDLTGVKLVMWHKASSAKDKTEVVILPDSNTKNVPSGGRLLLCGCDKDGKTPTGMKKCHAPFNCSKIQMSNTVDDTAGYTVRIEADGKLIHEVVFGKKGGIEGPPSSNGVPIRLAGEVKQAEMCTKSKSAKYWCSVPKGDTYIANNYGTPGDPNGDCCIYTPRAGDLRVNEVMVEAPGPEDPNEWVELYVVDGPGAKGELDLYGARIVVNKKGDDAPIRAAKATDLCLRVNKDDYLLLSHKATTTDGCTPDPTKLNFTFTANITTTDTEVSITDSTGKIVIAAPVAVTSAKEGQSYYHDATLTTTLKYATTPAVAKYEYCRITPTSGSPKIGYGTPGQVNTDSR